MDTFQNLTARFKELRRNSQNFIVIFLTALSLSPLPSLAQTAGSEFADIESWLNTESQKYYKPGSGEKWVRNSSPNGDRFIKVESPVDYKARNGRTYPVVIEKTGQIDGSKIGKAVVRFSKFLPPLAVGVEIYNVVCELSDICKKDGVDEWEVPITTGLAGLEQQISGLTGWVRNGNVCTETLTECKSNNGCGGTFDCVISDIYINGTQLVATYDSIRKSDGVNIGQLIYNKIDDGYTMPEPEKITPTEAEWTAAETKLNDPRFDEPLLANGQPVPLANLPILGSQPPITLEETETINKDGNGNVTGTTKSTTTLTISDGATEANPGRVIGTETTTKTDYNTSGQLTGSSTTETGSPPPDKPAEPPTISFDNVPDSEIEEEEIDAELEPPESWGEGACPADKTVSVGFGDLTFDMQPTCDFATGVRPVMLFIASITAMFIVSGIRIE